MTSPSQRLDDEPAPGPAAARAHLRVGENAHGQRIDNFLMRELKGFPRPRLYRLLRRGEVRVNRGRVPPHHRLEAGDDIRLPPFLGAYLRSGPGSTGPGRLDPALRRRLRASILYEDDRLLVVDKPAGLAVHGGSGLSFGVIEALRLMRPEAPYLELVHRLDRETSGCLLVAKRASMLRALHRALRERRVKKRYLALVRGAWSRPRAVTAPLLKRLGAGGEREVHASAAGKPATTRFWAIDASARATLVEAQPVTGRTHQIRVHAAASGHPLGGDLRYGDPEFNRELSGIGLHRLFLHAASLEIEGLDGATTAEPRAGRRHPGRAGAFQIRAPLPLPLQEVLDRLGLNLPPDYNSRP